VTSVLFISVSVYMYKHLVSYKVREDFFKFGQIRCIFPMFRFVSGVSALSVVKLINQLEWCLFCSIRC